VSVHGGIPATVSMIDGMRIGNVSQLEPDEHEPRRSSTTRSTSPFGTDAGIGDQRRVANAIPKSGGNAFHGSLLANGSAVSQGSNVNDRLRPGARPTPIR
jgi:hypothetical protein